MINIVFYMVVTGVLVGATACGVWRRYRRNDNENEFENVSSYSDSDSFLHEEGEDLAIL